jgi:hypothetical protein
MTPKRIEIEEIARPEARLPIVNTPTFFLKEEGIELRQCMRTADGTTPDRSLARSWGCAWLIATATVGSGTASEELLPNSGFEPEAGSFKLPATHPAEGAEMPRGWSMWQLFRGVYTVTSTNAKEARISIATSSSKPLLFDDASFSAWDGMSLKERIKMSAIETERVQREKEVLSDSQLKAKYGARLSDLYQQTDALKAPLSGELTAETESNAERTFDAILQQYQSLVKDIRMELLLR